MKTITHVKFDSLERQQIERALAGLVNVDTADLNYALPRFLNRVRQDDTFTYQQLDSADEAIDTLIGLLNPQTEVSWWRESGATGADDAVQGLADERLHQIRDLSALKAALIEPAMALCAVSTCHRPAEAVPA